MLHKTKLSKNYIDIIASKIERLKYTSAFTDGKVNNMCDKNIISEWWIIISGDPESSVLEFILLFNYINQW